MRYFLAVAEVESVNKASQNINVSAGSLSKAITRLEGELGVQLFHRVGRGIQLSPEGRAFKKKASLLLQLEEDIKYEFKGKKSGQIKVYISSEEIIQSSFGGELVKKINRVHPNAKITFIVDSEDKVIEQVKSGEAHLVFVTCEVPLGLKVKSIAKVNFKVCISKQHPLFKTYGKKSISITDLLKWDFVTPEGLILGRITKSTSVDGWRDDKFPRKIKYKVSRIKLMEQLIKKGLAIGYLPDYFIKGAELEVLNVVGCPYTCKQTIKIVTQQDLEINWLKSLWQSL